MATLSQLRQDLKATYGLAYDTVNDAKFSDAILNLALNDAHRTVAERTRCYRQRQVYDIPAAVHGVSSVPIECATIRIDDYSVEAYLNGSWIQLPIAAESDVRREYGALEALPSGTPQIAYLRHGEALDAQVVLDLVPGVATAITNGLVVQAYIWPGLMSADTDTPSLQVGLHRHLRTVAAWELARLDQASGRADAPVATWAREAELALREVGRLVEMQTQGNIRRVNTDSRDDW